MNKDINSKISMIIGKNRELHNRHQNERCFILGTGHSIGEQNLKLLEGEICIGVSKFFVHPDYNLIKPRYYCEAQYHIPFTEEWWQTWLTELADRTGEATMFFGLKDYERNLHRGLFTGRNVYFLEFSGSWKEAATIGIDLTRPIPPIQSVSVMALEVALYMGFKEIYLLGFDHDAIAQRGHVIHFYDKQFHHSHLDQYLDFDVEEQCLCYLNKWNQYKVIQQAASLQSTKIYNATPGGLLNLFPRIDYEYIFEKDRYANAPARKTISPELLNTTKKLIHDVVEQLGSGQPEEALKIADKILTLTSDMPDVHYLRCLCLRVLELRQEALEAAKAELAVNPGHGGAKKQIIELSTESNKLEPLSRKFGLDRGTSICRYYIDKFLRQNRSFIRGHVLEIGDRSYTQRYGSEISASEVLSVVPAPDATIVGDLSTGDNIPHSAFDCIIMTQTLQFIYEAKMALRHAIDAMKPGGTLLITATGISQISRYDMDRWGEYWRFTDKSLKMLLAEFVPENAIHIELFGNVASAKAFLDGCSSEELTPEQLDYQDKDYQVLIAARVQKPFYQTNSIAHHSSSPKSCVMDRVEKPDIVIETPLVLLYHRVADDSLDAQLLAVSADNFEAHLKELSKNYRVLPLYTLLEEIKDGVLQPNTVAITFDDGYLDNLTNAVPLLEKYGLPATVFVTSGIIGSQIGFWGDVVEHILLTGLPLPEVIRVSNHEGRTAEMRCSISKERLKVHDEIRALLRAEPPEVIDRFVNMLLTWSGINLDPQSICPVLNSQQLEQLAASPYIEIGAHSVTHTRLSVLSPERQREEIRESKHRIEALSKRPVRVFSYPYGTVADFTEETERIVREEGYLAGISNFQGNICAPVNLYSIPRRLVRDWPGELFREWLKETDKSQLESETISNRAARLIEYQERVPVSH